MKLVSIRIFRALKQALTGWVEMLQIILDCFDRTGRKTWDGIDFAIGFVFWIVETTLVIFCCQNSTSNFAIDLKKLSPVWCGPQDKYVWLQVPLVFSASLPK